MYWQTGTGNYYDQYFTRVYSGTLDSKDIQSIYTGLDGTCAISGIGDVTNGIGAGYCWGWSERSELGTPATNSTITSPRLMNNSGRKNGNEIVHMSIASERTCYVTGEKNSGCIGKEYVNEHSGALGDGGDASQYGQKSSLNSRFDNSNLASDEYFLKIGVSRVHACGITNKQNVFCWGSEQDGSNDADKQLLQSSNSDLELTKPTKTNYTGINGQVIK